MQPRSNASSFPSKLPKFISMGFYLVLIFIALSLATAVGLLIWHLLTPTPEMNCPPDPCRTTSFLSFNTSGLTPFSTTASSTLTTKTMSVGKKRTYKEPCEQWYDCYTEYGLLCESGWDENKTCLCEGSHYWSVQQNKCLRKGEVNDTCETDYQCHREIGLVCEQILGAAGKTCVCAADLYWAKESNCGQLSLQRIVDCTHENHATTCLALGMDNLYHMVTIRSVTEKELSFHWFLIDNRILSDLPKLSCTYNNETKYCFGLSVQDPQHSLKLAQFTRKGFHSVATLGGTNIGTAFGLTNIDSVAVFARHSQNTLYRRIIADDEVLSAHDVASSVTGDPTCYVYELVSNRPVYCFARNAVRGLSEYLEVSTNNWRVTQLGSSNERIRDDTAPVCNYVGSIYRYCFAILENGRISRIASKSGTWTTWQMIGPNQPHQFNGSLVFFTSLSLNASGPNQTCYVLAIDSTYHLQLSTNSNCAQSDSFSDWTPLFPALEFKQFDQAFNLRDGNIGIFGVNRQNQPYYTFLDRTNNQFTEPRLALSTKPEQFRP